MYDWEYQDNTCAQESYILDTMNDLEHSMDHFTILFLASVSN